MNYSKVIKSTPQNQPIPGRSDMKPNNAGGYSFEISNQERLERFLAIGSEGGTYYVSETDLTIESASRIINYIKADGGTVLKTVVDFAVNNRAPKADAGLFVLALLATYGTPDVKKATYSAISSVTKTSTHLFTFISNIQNLRGWSRGLRRGVASFYEGKPTDKLAYQLVKYRQRNGWTHADVIRLSHPSSKSNNNLLRYAVGKLPGNETENFLIDSFTKAMASKDGKEVVGLIKEAKLTWEMIPTELLNEPKVLTALLEHMPLHALLRNLNRFSLAGMTEGASATTKTIVSKLADVKNSNLHPVTILNTLRVYSAGTGDFSNKVWPVNQKIVDALDKAYYSAIEGLTPTGKNILVAVDVSGSMNSGNVGKSKLTPKDVAAALSMTLMRSEPNADLVWFDTKTIEPTIGKRSGLDEILRKTPNGGGTDCALAIIHPLMNNLNYDAIVILTDSETWAGKEHGAQALAEYRRKVNKNVKVIEIGMVANSVSSYPTEDMNVLRVAGFDSTVPEVINSFLSRS